MSQKLILCSVVDCVHQNASQELTNYPSKSIKFVASILKKAIANEVTLDTEEAELEQEVENLSVDSKSLAIEVISVILNEKHKLNDEDVCALKQCSSELETLSLKEKDQNVQKRINSLRDDISNLNSGNNDLDLSNDDKFKEALKDLNDPLLPVQAHALGSLKNLIYAKDTKTLENSHVIVERLKISLCDTDSYIYLSAINTFAALATVQTSQVLPVLTAAFLTETRSVRERVNVGEVIVQLSKRLGEMAPVYADPIINCLLLGLKDRESEIRTSCLSNLGEFCGVIKFSLSKYMTELSSAITALLQTDPSLDVKRAAVMFMHLVLNNIDKSSAIALSSHMSPMYRILKNLYNCTLDDALRLHAQLSLEQMEPISKEILFPETSLKKKIELL